MAAEATRTLDYWLPLITGAVGLTSGMLLEWLRDNRAYRREQDARSFQRRNALSERRLEFQRQTLLELQDAVIKLRQVIGQYYRYDLSDYTEHGERRVNPYPDDLRQKNETASLATILLGVRVRDDVVRNLLGELKGNFSELYEANTKETSELAMGRANATFINLNERIGELLRFIEEAEMTSSTL